jgi:hypothetical protein
VEAPDQLWSYYEFGKGKKYSDNQAEDMIREGNVLQMFDREAPGQLLRDAQLLWRHVRVRAEVPPKDSLPAQQQELGLNRDQTWSSHESEGEKLRRKK